MVFVFVTLSLPIKIDHMPGLDTTLPRVALGWIR